MDQSNVDYIQGWEDRRKEDIKRLDGYTNKMRLEMRLKRQLSDAELELITAVVEDQKKFLEEKA